MRVASRQCGALVRNEPRLLSRRWRINRTFATIRDSIPNEKADEKIRASIKKGNVSNLRTEENTPRSILCGTIITEGQDNLDPEHIISKLPSLSVPDSQQARIYHAVLLLSRAHATWLADHRDFLRPTLEKIFLGNSEGAPLLSHDSTFDVLSVVVDKIPDFSTRVKSRPVDVREADGLAFYAADAPCILPDLWDRIDPGPKRLRIGDTRQSTISFRLNEGTESSVNERGNQSDISSTTLKLPLANTIFQTGSEFTISASRWTLSPDGTSLEASRREDPKDRTILVLPRESQAHDSNQQDLKESISSLHFPLLPLTSRREIKSGMGNVIRQLMDVEQEGLPASSELEQAVSDHFKEHNMQPHVVSVWALLIPKALVGTAKDHVENLQHVFKRSEMSDASFERFQNSFAHLIMHGATLHRVQSGGGGWGPKAGLLSLDPATDFGEESSEMPTAFDLGLEMTDEDTSRVGRLASPGDSVQFFLATPSAAGATDSETVTGKEPSLSQTVTFGIGVANPIEEMLPETFSSAKSTTQAILRLGLFGALSEKGFILKNDRKGFSVQTKIDVPEATFSTSS